MNTLALLVAATVASQVSEPFFSARGAFFAVSVPDATASARWYTENLGLRVVLNPPKRDGTKVIALAGDGLLVELIEHDGAVALRQAAPKVTQDHMVHGVFKAGVVVNDWEGLVAGLKARSVPIAIGPFPRTAEQRANLLIRDDNGNYIQFFEPEPTSSEKPVNR